jgi:hypothetical protein
VSETWFQAPAIIWNILIILVVLTLGAGTVATLIPMLVTAGAVPVGVLNVEVL